MLRIYNPYIVAFIATIGGMMFGFDISSVSSFVGQEHYRNYFHHPSSLAQGGITASMAGGSLLASFFAGFISDKLGRKPTIQISSVIWMVGAAIQSSAQNQAQLIVGRVISGLAIGLASTQVPVYIAEMSPKNIRGRLVGIFQWAITWGIMIMFFIGYGCSFINGVGSFRLAWGLQIVPGALLCLGMLFLSESPRWLAAHDRWEEAIEIIANVQAKGDANHPDVLIEVEEIKEVIRIEREAKSLTLLDLFRKDSINRTMVGVWGQIWQQLCGMNVIMYYIVYIFQMAGFEGNLALVPSAIQYVLNMLMTVPALLWIDSWGRRPVFLVGGVLMMIWCFCAAGLLATYGVHMPNGINADNPNITLMIPQEHSSASKGVIACAYLFVASFAPTWGPGMWIYCSEIFPMKQRAIANGLTGAANWAFNFALAMFVPTAFQNITWKTYIIFGVFCFCMVIHVFLLFPETKGKTLEEIDQIWEEKIPAWRSASFVPRQPSISDVKAVQAAGSLNEKEVNDVASQV
ncbi:hexose transporter Hxt13p [Trichomonascus vanleenenianus]|uniref:sugar porter family MFS transporter n=1 Tax=Trichomonascus vanleenenianus TaxID=2268995 RepID=UPI003EC95DD1